MLKRPVRSGSSGGVPGGWLQDASRLHEGGLGEWEREVRRGPRDSKSLYSFLLNFV